MKNRGSKDWIWPPADQVVGLWGFLILATVSIVTSQVLSFFTRRTGVPWIFCYLIGIGIAVLGASLIFFAKLPLYRERRFFTIGSKALPEQRRPFYRWGYRCALVGILLLACLLLSSH